MPAQVREGLWFMSNRLTATVPSPTTKNSGVSPFRQVARQSEYATRLSRMNADLSGR